MAVAPPAVGVRCGRPAARRPGSVTEQERTLGEVAAEHVTALDLQIGILRLRRAVLNTVAGREPTVEEMERMHQLATLSEAERRRLTDDFLDAVFDGRHGEDDHAAVRRSLTPELPDNPSEDQIAAWVELAELSLDPGFRAGLRSAVEDHAADLPAAAPPRPDVVAVTRGLVKAAVTSGIGPDSPPADPVVAGLTAACARTVGRPDDAQLHGWLLHRLESANDPRRDRYAHLLAVINGWPAPEPLAPVIGWAVAALRRRTAR
ncbi:MerR family transcriptional regulator [Streptomyces sp. NPDC101150]|uniref:MerR family transcriptional regulator n=1 Tax=Streptomyces sp. NPDC101150 TaxID=3366114 RepID=UPI003816431A